MPFTALIRRLHIWAGLFGLTGLMVMATAGIVSTFPGATPPREVREVAYEVPGRLTDKQVADDVFDRLDMSVVARVPAWAVHRDAANHLALDFYGPNGTYHVSVLEEAKLARIEFERAPLALFINTMHRTSLYWSGPDLRIRLWGLYVDLSMLCLLFLACTGPWLWLSSRPRLWWARGLLLTGAATFAALWMVTR